MGDFTRVYFEGLGIEFDLPSVAFSIGGYEVHPIELWGNHARQRNLG